VAEYLVTGGAGFIGSHVVEELLRRGERVRVLDNFSTGKRENIAQLRGRLAAELPEEEVAARLVVIEGDVRSYHIVREAVEGVDYVLHQAALPSVPRSVKDPITTNEVNVVGTLNVLNAAKEAGVKRIVYASSSSIYGDLETLPKTEDMLPKPLSPYAVSKLAGEKYCQVFTRLYGLETVCLRYFNVFGPRQDPESQYSAVIPKFIRMMARGERPTVYGDGSQSRDFTYVANVVQANLLACQADAEQASGEVFNIAYGRRVTINELVRVINQLLGTEVAPVYSEPRLGDVKHSLANIGKARQYLGYAPDTDFAEGLRRCIEFFVQPEDRRRRKRGKVETHG
jgi:UDP-glucose 4-epimerase